MLRLFIEAKSFFEDNIYLEDFFVLERYAFDTTQ